MPDCNKVYVCGQSFFYKIIIEKMDCVIYMFVYSMLSQEIVSSKTEHYCYNKQLPRLFQRSFRDELWSAH